MIMLHVAEIMNFHSSSDMMQHDYVAEKHAFFSLFERANLPGNSAKSLYVKRFGRKRTIWSRNLIKNRWTIWKVLGECTVWRGNLTNTWWTIEKVLKESAQIELEFDKNKMNYSESFKESAQIKPEIWQKIGQWTIEKVLGQSAQIEPECWRNRWTIEEVSGKSAQIEPETPQKPSELLKKF